jgi:predicted PurR-regulated permease PerM
MTNATSTAIIKKLLLLFLLVAGLYFAKRFLVPLSIAAVLATLFLPLCSWLEQKRVPRWAAALTCLILLFLAASFIGAMLGWQIAELANDIVQIKLRTLHLFARFQQFIFSHFNISLQEQTQIIKNQQNFIASILSRVAGSLSSALMSFILTVVYVFLLLYYRSHIKDFILQLTSPAHREETRQVIYRAAHVSQQYLLGLSKMILCLWIMYGISFSLLGIKNAIFFAILCGLLEIVPFIGNLTGVTITVLVAVVHGAELSLLVGVVGTYGAVQLIQGWILEPLILGPQVKINPLFTILALVVGELIWGIPGIVLAIPLTAILKIVCDHIDSLKPYGFLMGEIKQARKIKLFFKK